MEKNQILNNENENINKNKYCFMEIVPYTLTNRGRYINSQEVIKYAFEYRYIETWRGMFLYSTDKPKSTDKMIGNFYIESDNENFDVNVKIIKTATDYLMNKYKITEENLNYFITNRSVWCEIPYKVFGIYPQKNLNRIYKEMAKEINEYICKTLEIQKALDLSIYKWNGLIHALGSYLPNSNRWVKKFSYIDLYEKSFYHSAFDYTSFKQYLLNAKYDNLKDFTDIGIINECQNWAIKIYQKLNYKKKNDTQINKMKNISEEFSTSKPRIQALIEKIREIPFIEGNRNTLIFSYALLLKKYYVNTEENSCIVENEIEKWVMSKDDAYYITNSREISKTIDSAIMGTNEFSITYVEEVFNIDLSEFKTKSYNDTFILPRKFIELLQKDKCKKLSYLILLKMLYSEQVLNQNYEYNLKNEKYKKNIISNFENLTKLGLISYTLKENIITAKLTQQPYEIYKSHVIVPNFFINKKSLKIIEKDITILFELLRSNYIGKYGILMTNIKLSTICKNISVTLKRVRKVINLFKKHHIICGKYITFGNKKLCGEISKTLLKKLHEKLDRKAVNITKKINNYCGSHEEYLSEIHSKKRVLLKEFYYKMIYSLIYKTYTSLDISILWELSLKNIFGGINNNSLTN